MYLDLELNLATFEYIDGFGNYHFCLNGFGLELMISFWTSSQLSVQFWGCRLTVDCSHRYAGTHFFRHTVASPWAYQRKSRTNDPEHNSNWDYSTHLTRFALLLPRIQRYMWRRNHIATCRAGARWLGAWGPRRGWKLGPPIYNTLHLTHSIYVNKSIDLF